VQSGTRAVKLAFLVQRARLIQGVRVDCEDGVYLGIALADAGEAVGGETLGGERALGHGSAQISYAGGFELRKRRERR
jgi:hypothetical protein